MVEDLKNLWNVGVTVIPIVIVALRKGDLRNWKPEKEPRPSRLQHY